MASTSATHSRPFVSVPLRSPSARKAPPRKAAGKGRRKLVLAVLTLLVAALAGGALTFQAGVRSGMAATPEAFAEQMEAAARTGGGTVPHVFGGTIRSERNGSVLALVADNVPPSACVSVGWKLVRKGLLSINGTMPLRVSAARLSDLCNQEDGGAVLTWIPKAAE